ncbi:F0F1 ATP synthase subunit delta [Phycicoccus endophyticus]|uniref:ATP synthase subunit delta n=1 Tax=Phycicoccus endophyticus TaxID=1690220 RepID=A0A7G9QYK4_9MICO|nr:F0F1 ATP synthase subunit delta [Phycicoccus endophyticus]NHI19333.1 F0F1 ATP synthase subunit delta [Phycicoccus endophyticus]QNN48429.1 F0F1 ATP synthase subunit delta [Phycicoccus endophyticus]GGL41923.1 ATP synthase subunit delta [Phycicoccus endophyticus]
MRGSSRGAARASQEALDTALGGSVDAAGLAEELFAVTGVVEGSASLRRALADPSREGEAKAGLARSLLGGKVGEAAVELVATVAGQRWAAERDLGDMLESLAVQALLAGAESAGHIDRVEDELFRFERIVAADPGLRDTLSSRNTDGEGKASLVHTLLEGKAAAETVRLAEQAVRVPRGRRLDRVLETYLELAARRRDELTALVTAAVPLSEQQHHRLRTALEEHYGKAVTLQVVLDPGVIGGIRVQVGDEVVDGTVLRRLDEARRHVTGG